MVESLFTSQQPSINQVLLNQTKNLFSLAVTGLQKAQAKSCLPAYIPSYLCMFSGRPHATMRTLVGHCCDDQSSSTTMRNSRDSFKATSPKRFVLKKKVAQRRSILVSHVGVFWRRGFGGSPEEKGLVFISCITLKMWLLENNAGSEL